MVCDIYKTLYSALAEPWIRTYYETRVLIDLVTLRFKDALRAQVS